jgi:hypothetical protein
LVIAPWRRVSPELFSAGHQAEVAHQPPGAIEALEVADLGAQPDRRERVDPAQAAQPRDRLRPRRAGHELGDRGLQAVATDDQRVDRAEVVQQRDLRAARAEIDPGQPRAMARGPRTGGVLVADLVAQQQLAQPPARAHQAAQILPRADQVTQRLLLAAGDSDRVQAVDQPQPQPQHALGVALVGLDAILGRPLDLARAATMQPIPPACSARASPTRSGRPHRPPASVRAARSRTSRPRRSCRQPPGAHLARRAVDGHR